jgi:SAM-dependent methyltransferase
MFEVIEACRGCGSSSLEPILSLGEMPLVDRLIPGDDVGSPEPTYPLTTAYCDDCSLVQILESLAPEVLFPAEYPYFSSVSATLLDHSRIHAEALIEERSLNAASFVVEVASNDGYLLRWFADAGIPVLGFEPTEGPARAAEDAGIPTNREFFGIEAAERLVADMGPADVVLANNVFAHVADQNEFLRSIRTILAEDGVAVMEAPYVRDLVENTEFDTIYHEHRCYFSVTSVEALARRNHLFPVEQYLRAEQEAGLAEASYYRGFSDRVGKVIEQFRALIDERVASGRRVAAYGAAAKGAVLLNSAGIGRDRIDWVADRNVHKQGKLMPGVRLPIVSVETIDRDPPDDLVILAWNFKDEIIAQQRDFSRRGGVFIVPIPNPEVVAP